MTALTPEQYRALANEYAGVFMEGQYGYETPIPAALRTAADQLEAVHRWNWRHEGTFADDELEAILTTGTAPQEDRVDCGVVSLDDWGYPPTFCTKTAGHDGVHNKHGRV